MANLDLHRSMHILNGLIVPRFIKQETLDKMKSMTVYNDDVWVVSFPKSGTTWTKYLVYLIQHNGDDNVKNIDDVVLYLDGGTQNSLVTAEELTSPRTFHSHLPYDRMACGKPSSMPCKYVYVTRNPKDVATSLFHHYRAIHVPGIEWKEFFEYFMAGKTAYGDYFDHVLSWWAHKDDINVFFVKYEDLKNDPVTVITQLANFLGYQHLSKETINNISAKAGFDTMKANSLVNRTWRDSLRDPRAPPFMRRGVIVDWKNHLSSDESHRIDKVYQTHFVRNGLEFEFEEPNVQLS